VLEKLSIIIPVYNEAATVWQLLEQVSQQVLPGNLKKEMIIVESGSNDSSRELVQKFIDENASTSNIEFKLIHQEKARGKGFAMREGLLHASGEIILIQDADLEYDAKDYPELIQPILDGHTRFVLGSRHLSAGSWKIRNFRETPLKAFYMNLGGSLFHLFFNILYGTNLTDPTTMYKVFLRSCVEGIQFESNRFDFDFELVAKLIRSGHAPLEVPVSYHSRGFEKGKKVNILRDPFMWVWAIIKFRLSPIAHQQRNQKN
jgi:glycosyltransferase involved in cell wall biosynthesis